MKESRDQFGCCSPLTPQHFAVLRNSAKTMRRHRRRSVTRLRRRDTFRVGEKRIRVEQRIQQSGGIS
uniref:Uncharacterized protein n=1 Tax=Romanomermis culicivorax TaxID=13658 RepID=A0A915JI07_ROMCU